MSYQSFREQFDREYREAVLPSVSHDDPGYIWAPSRHPGKAFLLSRISARLGDDPQRSIEMIEELCNDPMLRTEAREFYQKKLTDLKRSVE